MYAKSFGMAVMGFDGYEVTVEVDISAGLPCFEIVGLPTASVREAKERVRAALKNSGFEVPLRRIIVNLAPADVRKDSAGLDLPIALGILAASEENKARQRLWKEKLQSLVCIGELSLDGLIKGVPSTFAMLQSLPKDKQTCIISEEDKELAYIEPGLSIYSASTLRQVVTHIVSDEPLDRVAEKERSIEASYTVDFQDVQGQDVAKRAFLIAAAGYHHIFLSGMPGAGKNMLAKRLPTILPPLTREEWRAVNQIYSVANSQLLQERPFRSPHHTITVSALAGGGRIPKPGEITLAHKGVLFLDEIPEFHRSVLETLRQPLESGIIHISRVQRQFNYPARFLLVAAANPCPCGWYGASDGIHQCRCTMGQVNKYQQTLSGPMLDRIDLTIQVERPKLDELSISAGGLSSKEMRQQVVEARERQAYRYRKVDRISKEPLLNGLLSHNDLLAWAPLTMEAQTVLEGAFTDLGLSLRSYDRIWRLAQTIADIEGANKIEAVHIAEALSYRKNEQ